MIQTIEQHGHLYYLWGHGWQQLPITRVTPTTVYVCHPGRQDDSSDTVKNAPAVVALDRRALETTGWATCETDCPGRFYTHEGRPKPASSDSEDDIAMLDAYMATVGLKPVMAEERTVLGLVGTVNKSKVLSAFRKLAHTHHPDSGGDPDQFRKIVDAKDNLLALVGQDD
ncbi:MAG: hypothetical protein ACR2PA_17175 [Hyphomicrobiaceae bacterium]